MISSKRYCKGCNSRVQVSEFRGLGNLCDKCFMIWIRKDNIKKRLISAVGSVLKRNTSFSSLVGEALPYTAKDLRDHFESLFEPWMNWNNYGAYRVAQWDDNDLSTWKWQVDHIIPQSAFNYESSQDQQFKICWGLKNLRPLSSKSNALKGDRYHVIY